MTAPLGLYEALLELERAAYADGAAGVTEDSASVVAARAAVSRLLAVALEQRQYPQ